MCAGWVGGGGGGVGCKCICYIRLTKHRSEIDKVINQRLGYYIILLTKTERCFCKQVITNDDEPRNIIHRM